MNDGPGPEAALIIKVRGPLVGDRRIAFTDLANTAAGIQQTLNKLGQVIQSGASRPGRIPAWLETMTRLEMTDLKVGSAVIVADFPTNLERAFSPMDVGEIAIERLVDGLAALNEGELSPDDWDDGVFRAVHQLGRLIGHGRASEIELSRKGHRKARFTNETSQQVRERLARPLPLEYRTVLGRLMMVDFDAERRKCRIETPKGERIDGTFPLDLMSEVLRNATRFVEAEGYATEHGARIKHLSVLRLVPVTTPAGIEAESRAPSLSQLIEEQNVPPMTSSDDLVDSDLWESEEELNRFLTWVRSERDSAAVGESS